MVDLSHARRYHSDGDTEIALVTPKQVTRELVARGVSIDPPNEYAIVVHDSDGVKVAGQYEEWEEADSVYVSAVPGADRTSP